MNRIKPHLVLSTGISLLIATQVQASGFQLSEHSASGLGRAFAGEAAVADNASVLSRNPAAMSRFDRAAVSGAVSFIDATVEVSGTSDSYSDVEDNDVVPEAFVPAAYYIQPLNDKWAVGFAIYSNFGLATEYSENFADGENAGSTELTTLNFNPNISYKVNDILTLGAGVSAVYGEAKIARNFGEKWAAVFSALGAESSDNLKSLEGSSWGYGWNLGALIELNENNRFGLAYHSKVDIDFEGDYSSDISSAVSATGTDGDTVTGDLTLNLPDIFEISGYHKLNPKFAVHYSAMWTGWSRFEELSAFVGSTEVLQKDQKFSDSWRYSLGSTVYYNHDLELRFGVAFDEAASTTHMSIGIPDSDRWHYNTGLTYRFNNDLSMDFGLSYIVGDDIDFDEGDYSYQSQGEVFITSLQVNYLL